VKEPSKNHDIWVRALFGGSLRGRVRFCLDSYNCFYFGFLVRILA